MILDLNGNRIIKPGVLLDVNGTVLKLGELHECEEYGLAMVRKLKMAYSNDYDKKSVALDIVSSLRLYSLPEEGDVFDRLANCSGYATTNEFKLNPEVDLIRSFI